MDREVAGERGNEDERGNRSQAILPESAKNLYNRKGTASRMWFERDGKVLVFSAGCSFRDGGFDDPVRDPGIAAFVSALASGLQDVESV